jgi:hypothetical protein
VYTLKKPVSNVSSIFIMPLKAFFEEFVFPGRIRHLITLKAVSTRANCLQAAFIARYISLTANLGLQFHPFANFSSP